MFHKDNELNTDHLNTLVNLHDLTKYVKQMFSNK